MKSRLAAFLHNIHVYTNHMEGYVTLDDLCALMSLVLMLSRFNPVHTCAQYRSLRSTLPRTTPFHSKDGKG